jgi:hypothetical protein
MLVQFYKILMVACMNALVPNLESLRVLVPEHQQMYVIQGAVHACQEELKSEKLLACTEQPSFCTE